MYKHFFISSHQLVLAFLSGLFLALPFLYSQLFWLTWLAFVPLMFALNNTSLAQSYTVGLVSGLTIYISGAYWIIDFISNFKGYSSVHCYLLAAVFWLYSAQLNALMSVLYVWLSRVTEASAFVLFPAVVVTLYSIYPQLFSVQIGASQSYFLIALQAIEYTGVYGLDFIIAITNVLLFKLLTNIDKNGNTRLDQLFSIFVCLLLTAWFCYGFISLNIWDKISSTSPHHLIGIVQPNEEPSIEIPSSPVGYAYPPEMEMTEKLVEKGAELVVWPESRFKGYYQYKYVREAFRYYIASIQTPLMFQDMEKVRAGGEVKNYNTSILINAQGKQQEYYRKIKRVAIGEYFPLVDNMPAVKKIAKYYLGDFFSDFSQGEGPKLFAIDGMNVVPLICYEVMFPLFVANAIPAEVNGVVLVAQSSNGWFGETRQPYQHFYASVLRSVENRLPLVHAVNNGPSGIALPSGRILFESSYHQVGGFLVDMPIASVQERSFFSRYPHLFIFTVYGVLGLIVVREGLRRLAGSRDTS